MMQRIEVKFAVDNSSRWKPVIRGESAKRPDLWSAVAERSGDTALAFRQADYRSADPKRCRRFALPPHSKTLGALLVTVLCHLPMTGLAGRFTVGPDYRAPVNVVPPTYKAQELGEWKEGQPLDHVPKGAWWEIFGDEHLNELERQATSANQDVRAALARVEQARATARVARGELLPLLTFDPAWRRERFSENQFPNFGNATVNTFRVPLDLSYEIDLWGRIRRGFEGARADAQASLAGFHNMLLTLQADVAQNYFALRALDAEMQTVERTVAFRKEEMQLVQSRFEGGISSDLDVARAATELAAAEAELAGLARRRAELENAIAILAGANPSEFRLASAGDVNWNPAPPPVPAGLPANLLERRPDVAEAERQLAAANARIGVAKAAFFPVLSLTGSGGFVSAEMDNLFNWSSRAWSIGPSVSLPIFAGGRNRANLKRARASYEETIARYRQQVLVAFGEVENSLASLHHLSVQAAAQQRAVANAQRAADLASERYRAGLVSYLEVVDANRAALQTERGKAQLTGQQLAATAQLIKAIGGGWSVDHLTPQLASTKRQISVPTP